MLLKLYRNYFTRCVQEAYNNNELVKQYERLYEVRIKGGSPIAHMIDKATGYDKVQHNNFCKFVEQYIFCPTLLQYSKDIIAQFNKHNFN